VQHLAGAGVTLFGGVRRDSALPTGVTPVVTGDLAEPGLALPPVDAVVHAAGLGHRRGVGEATWQRENVQAAVNLARAARQAGAKKFVLISTAYIHGRVHDGLVTDTTPPNPMDAYAESKLQAEYEVAAAFGAGFTPVRPVAVIGPGAPGNLQLLIRLLKRGIPLPFAGIVNRRNFIARADLAAIVAAVLAAERAPGSVLAAHPQSIGTPDLIRALAEGVGRPARLFRAPNGLLGTGAMLAGRAAMWQSLAGNFAANPAAALGLGWKPAERLEESLTRTSRYHDTTSPNP
jgi:nucleoside-diphosphate-sugar epimerase